MRKKQQRKDKKRKSKQQEKDKKRKAHANSSTLVKANNYKNDNMSEARSLQTIKDVNNGLTMKELQTECDTSTFLTFGVRLEVMIDSENTLKAPRTPQCLSLLLNVQSEGSTNEDSKSRPKADRADHEKHLTDAMHTKLMTSCGHRTKGALVLKIRKTEWAIIHLKKHFAGDKSTIVCEWEHVPYYL